MHIINDVIRERDNSVISKSNRLWGRLACLARIKLKDQSHFLCKRALDLNSDVALTGAGFSNFRSPLRLSLKPSAMADDFMAILQKSMEENDLRQGRQPEHFDLHTDPERYEEIANASCKAMKISRTCPPLKRPEESVDNVNATARRGSLSRAARKRKRTSAKADAPAVETDLSKDVPNPAASPQKRPGRASASAAARRLLTTNESSVEVLDLDSLESEPYSRVSQGVAPVREPATDTGTIELLDDSEDDLRMVVRAPRVPRPSASASRLAVQPSASQNYHEEIAPTFGRRQADDDDLGMRFDGDDEDTAVLDVSSQPENDVMPAEPLVTSGTKRAVPASSYSEQANTSPKKRKRAPKQANEPKEVRGARYRSVPSKSSLERWNRSTQRLYLIERKDTSSDLVKCEVMGTNGNVYTCDINLEPSCTCPDFRKRKQKGQAGPCKHLIFVFMRILKVRKEDPLWWQVRLLPSELRKMLDEAPEDPGTAFMADESVRAQYRASSSQEAEVVRRTVEGDCPICFEDMAEGDGSTPQNVATWCQNCGHNFHKLCLDNWMKARSNAACPLCRRPLVHQQKPSGEKEYMNLSQFSTKHTRSLTLQEMYADTHEYIGRGGHWRRGRGRRR